MRIKANKTIVIIALGLVTIALSACGTPGSNILGGAAGQPTATNASPTQPEISPEPPTPTIPESTGHIIFVSDMEGVAGLYLSTPDGSEQTRLTEFTAEDLSISPDGTRVAFVSNANGNADIYILDIATHNVTRITDAAEKDSAPSWSHDGTRLAFESFRDGNFEIYMVNADGSNPTRLTNDAAFDGSPMWSPVADEIAFTSNRFGNSNILIVTPNGSISSLTTSSDPDSAPAWSPDGRMIAFQSSSGNLSNICLIGRDALNQRCVTTVPSDYGVPVWSPDGGFLAVHAKQSAGYGINIYNISDGSILELSAPGIDPRGDPAWSPEGLRVVFQAQADGNMYLFTALISANQFTRITAINSHDGEPVWNTQ
ncbi:MAG: PD40 domain-containing protein [Anaerolineales bacterium]|nr:PD40 domain-containing protein [Anaerolineales bacterium]